MKYLISLFLLTAMINCLNATPSVNMEQWRQFKAEHGKVYKTQEEENKRMALFFENVALVEEHNEAFERGETTFDMKLNHLSDMLPEEIYPSDSMAMDFETLSKSNSDPDGMIFKKWVPPVGVQAPDSVDWRTKGYVTSVKYQGCNNCYTFSAVGGLEGQVAKHTGVLLTSLSTQQLTDCTRHGNGGCKGGTMDRSYKDVFSYGGIQTDEDYPNTGRTQTCKFNESAVAAKVSGFLYFQPTGNEELIKLAVATLGPIPTAVSARGKFAGFGSKGVYYSPTCISERVNHAVLIVGYGTLNGTDYWLVKNSWGSWWGDKGYIRMARNHRNNCWLASKCILPILVNTNSTF